MVLNREIRPGLFSVGAIDWDRRLFDALIPLPDGTSYNSYLVRGGEKTALIDAVDATKAAGLIENLRSLGVERIDFVVAQHAEQDHSGGLPELLQAYPEAKVLGSARCLELLREFGLAAADRMREVKDGEMLELGGKSLQFISAPWVHWPDTILTYLPEQRILFSCDFLGSHLATSNLFAEDEAAVYASAKRYYAEIMMPFRQHIRRHLERIGGMQVDVIAPSHGPVHGRPQFILDAYREWSSDAVKDLVVLPYVSMHGSTRVMVDYLADALIARGVQVRRFDLTAFDTGHLAEALVDAATVVIGTPTILGGAHPLALYAAVLANALRPKARYATIIGSFGWGGKMLEQITEALPNLKLQLLDPVVARGLPKEEDYKALDRLADEIAALHAKL
ncbi:MAG TPA: FprA family A-type flavoprotein [Methanothrix sp.]|nr:FprA family A-type flavoprotein [Methanothrix sp.]HOV82911.1 FprA family A-type flavoprotein [Methanothrix sp.]HPC89236.1 FprA family A-type flavoprotein [Methanothrix sp.]HQE87155.1 FprA family A-type flavoprotein [Methanothrix sp.]HQI68965.1 FprA family A-type flavoprotein [Methanothrix sp.]